jgi:hypothetical protein
MDMRLGWRRRMLDVRGERVNVGLRGLGRGRLAVIILGRWPNWLVR